MTQHSDNDKISFVDAIILIKERFVLVILAALLGVVLSVVVKVSGFANYYEAEVFVPNLLRDNVTDPSNLMQLIEAGAPGFHVNCQANWVFRSSPLEVTGIGTGSRTFFKIKIRQKTKEAVFECARSYLSLFVESVAADIKRNVAKIDAENDYLITYLSTERSLLSDRSMASIRSSEITSEKEISLSALEKLTVLKEINLKPAHRVFLVGDISLYVFLPLLTICIALLYITLFPAIDRFCKDLVLATKK